MNIRQFLKKSDTVVGLNKDLKKLQRTVRCWFSGDALHEYVQNHSVRKLQIGAGPSALPGWLVTDVLPWHKDIVFLDATRPFPLDNATFDYIHSEHMIEHITWDEGLAMLRECRRILKPGGIIRIATPDLEAFARLYQAPAGSLGERYIHWIIDKYWGYLPDYREAFVINALFYFWGHRFLYDYQTLELAMRQVGFTEISRHFPGESDDEILRGIETHGQTYDNEEMNRFETLILEGKCPISQNSS